MMLLQRLKTPENLFGHYFVPILGLVSAKNQFSDAEKSQEKNQNRVRKSQEFGIWKSRGHPEYMIICNSLGW